MKTVQEHIRDSTHPICTDKDTFGEWYKASRSSRDTVYFFCEDCTKKYKDNAIKEGLCALYRHGLSLEEELSKVRVIKEDEVNEELGQIRYKGEIYKKVNKQLYRTRLTNLEDKELREEVKGLTVSFSDWVMKQTTKIRASRILGISNNLLHYYLARDTIILEGQLYLHRKPSATQVIKQSNGKTTYRDDEWCLVDGVIYRQVFITLYQDILKDEEELQAREEVKHLNISLASWVKRFNTKTAPSRVLGVGFSALHYYLKKEGIIVNGKVYLKSGKLDQHRYHTQRSKNDSQRT